MRPNFSHWCKVFAALLCCTVVCLNALAQAPAPNAGAAGGPPLPVFYGALHGVGHIGTVTQPGGGEFANVASKKFAGAKCGLRTKPNWDAQSKRLPE